MFQPLWGRQASFLWGSLNNGADLLSLQLLPSNMPLIRLLPTSLSCSGPRYHLLAHTTLTLAAVQDGFRTHDLTLASHGEYVCMWGMLDGEKRGRWMVPFTFPTLTLRFFLPQRRTPPGCPFMVACVAVWWLSLSA